VPLTVAETDLAKSMQGVALSSARLTAFQCLADEIDVSMAPRTDTGRGIPGKRPRPPVIESRTGDIMLTHFGLSGPVTLLMSLAIVDSLEHGPVSVSIDLKSEISVDELRRRLQSDFDAFGKRSYRNILKTLLPEKLVGPFVEMSGIPAEKRGHEINAEERERLLGKLKSLRFNIKSPRPMSEALVTAGGVSLKEMDPHTMESRLVKGLYLCGEVTDLDAETGGYNLQAAFSTGWVAGENAARQCLLITAH
jgi:predicted Rossmann fold flavoprotein